MLTYGRAAGLLGLTGLAGFLLLGPGADAQTPDYVPRACQVAQPQKCPDPFCTEEVRAVKTVAAKPTKAEQRAALVAQLLPILETTKSGPAFAMTLETLVALDAPAEQVVPLCLRAMERLDQFKPIPADKDTTQALLMECVGESLQRLLMKKVKVTKSAPDCVTLPAPIYLQQTPQFMPAMPCPLQPGMVCPPGVCPQGSCPPGMVCPVPCAPGMRCVPGQPCQPAAESSSMHDFHADFWGIAREAVKCFTTPAQPYRLPEPVPTYLTPTAPLPSQPVQRPMTSSSFRPQFTPVESVTTGGIIPVSTLPPAQPTPLEVLPTTDPDRLVPVPMPK